MLSPQKASAHDALFPFILAVSSLQGCVFATHGLNAKLECLSEQQGFNMLE